MVTPPPPTPTPHPTPTPQKKVIFIIFMDKNDEL